MKERERIFAFFGRHLKSELDARLKLKWLFRPQRVGFWRVTYQAPSP
jgi:hypothetical protein